jgi:hypothetical protein
MARWNLVSSRFVPHPLQGRNLVEDALVASAVELVTTDPLAAREAEQAKPVIERNHHHLTPRGGDAPVARRDEHGTT